MADWGFKVSQTGYDVKTATDQQLIMSSSFNALKVKMVGTTTGSVAHGLAYIPAYLSTSQLNSSSKWSMVGQGYYSSYHYMTSSNFVSSGNNTKYYIFYQDAQG